MPREYYTSPDVLPRRARADLCAASGIASGGPAASRSPGDYIVRDVAGESLIIVARPQRRAARVLQRLPPSRHAALYREHRGSSRRRFSVRITRGRTRIDGRLIGAPHMHEVEGFDKRDYPLHAAAVAEWEGLRVREHRARAPAVRAVVRADAAAGSSRYNLADA